MTQWEHSNWAGGPPFFYPDTAIWRVPYPFAFWAKGWATRPYNNSTLGGWDTPNPPTPFTGRNIYHDANADCDTANCLVNNTDAYQANPAGWPKYKYLGGPNSNTWLRNLFGSCGINLHNRWYGPPILYFWPLP